MILRHVAADNVISVEVDGRKQQLAIEDFTARLLSILAKHQDSESPLLVDGDTLMRRTMPLTLQLATGWEWVEWSKSRFNPRNTK
jgi:hypothetical protein